jgi:hypothetical protein
VASYPGRESLAPVVDEYSTHHTVTVSTDMVLVLGAVLVSTWSRYQRISDSEAEKIRGYEERAGFRDGCSGPES